MSDETKPPLTEAQRLAAKWGNLLNGPRKDIKDIIIIPSQERMSTIEIIPGRQHRLGFKKLDPEAKIPTKAHTTDLGLDLYCLETTVLVPNEVTKIRTGIAAELPIGYGALIRDRSSVATKIKVFVVAGVIDQNYTGEILVAMYNPGITESSKEYGSKIFSKGDKIAQLILTPLAQFPIVEIDNVEQTDRGSSGFGSSGV